MGLQFTRSCLFPFMQIMKTPPTSFFLKKAAGLGKGGGKAGHDVCGKISLKHIYEIAKVGHCFITFQPCFFSRTDLFLKPIDQHTRSF